MVKELKIATRPRPTILSYDHFSLEALRCKVELGVRFAAIVLVAILWVLSRACFEYQVWQAQGPYVFTQRTAVSA